MAGKYQYKEGGYKLTEQMKRDFNENGFIMVRNFLDDEELTNIKKAIEDNSTILSNAFGVADDTGKDAQLSLWNHPGNDVTGMVARCEKIVNTCEHLLGGEVYHYHTKLMMKAAKKGGKHVWHQDYGGQNLSNDRRWAFLCAYNKATNNPVKKHHHPCYTPLVK
ncbi:hypothetical protein KUTeg_022506, partial [Tegillarca granosa]